jgi:serine protease Do
MRVEQRHESWSGRPSTRVAGACAAGLLSALGVHDASCAADTARVQSLQATLEVLIPRNAVDTLVYDHPLPQDGERYDSVGTAFAIGRNRYVSAAHVFGIGLRTLKADPVLRDAAGKLHAIDSVLQYSSAKDFMVFTLEGDPEIAPLPIGAQPSEGDPVSTVGNALGQGIVVRAGVLTSETPEEQGRWKWLRFSAPASPGNSGGPLLDGTGHVVGLVTMKSPNENLNYALPIQSVLEDSSRAASIAARGQASIPVLDATVSEPLDQAIALPQSYHRFAKQAARVTDEFRAQLLQHLLSQNRSVLFPRGGGSEMFLQTNHDALRMPNLISRGADGNWRDTEPTDMTTALVGHHGKVTLGFFKGHDTLLLRIERPEDIPAARFFDDSKLFGELALKVIDFDRFVKDSRARIVSLGQAESAGFEDSYGRKWRLYTWPIAVADEAVVAVTLPVPDGYIAILRKVPTAASAASAAVLKILTDFVDWHYSGTVRQWQEFLALPALLPHALAPERMTLSFGKVLGLRLPECSLSVAPQILGSSEQDVITLHMGYFVNRGVVVWDVEGANVTDADRSAVSLMRHSSPSSELPQRIRNTWRTMQEHAAPFDDKLHIEGGNTTMRTVLIPDTADSSAPATIYSLKYTVSGEHPGDTAVETAFATLERSLRASR